MQIKSFKKYLPVLYILALILLSLGQLIFAFRTNAYFSVDDFAVLAYFKTHSILQMIPDFLIHGDIFNFRRLVGFIFFGEIFKTFGVSSVAFNIAMFLTNTANLIILYLIVKKLTKNDFAAFFVSAIFNKNYLFYYSNIHEHLLALFCFLTIYFFVAYPKRFYLSVITLILALFTKETAFTVPLVLLAISLFYKTDRKKIYILLGISVLFGLYAGYFFITQKILIPNFSYTVSPKPIDVLKGLLFFVDYKILITLCLLPILTKKYKLFPLLLVALLTLVPASLLVNRREMYYIYMPFGYLMIYLGMFLPKLNLKTLILYVILYFILGGRSVLPKIARQVFPNWQKVSMDNVIQAVGRGTAGNPKTATISLKGINIERDAGLMLGSNDLDLFVSKTLSSEYNFTYNQTSDTVVATRKI